MGKGKKLFKRLLSSFLSLALVMTGVSFNGTSAQAAEDGLILYYDFNLQNSFSTDITDASGNRHNGTLKSNGGGSVEGTYSIDNVNIYGKTVKALKLTGGESGPYLQMPDGILSGNEAVTISVWVKLTTDNAYQRIWDFGNDTSSYIYLLSDGWSKGFMGYASAITTGGPGAEKGVQKGTDDEPLNIDKNRWVLTTVVMDGTEMSLYENGKQVGETVDTGISVDDLGETTANYIGKGQFADPLTEGQFAEVKIYNKALSADEIAAMYDVDDAGIVSSDKEELSLGDTSKVTEDITLPAKGVSGSDITWTSANPAIAIEDGIAKVTRPAKGEADVSGKLTAEIKYGTASDKKEFDVTVLAEYTDEQIAEHDAEAIADAIGDLSSVMGDITLPEAEWGSTVAWESQNPAVAIEDGVAKVTRPAVGEENATGKLILTVTSGEASVKKEFDVTVIALREAVKITETEKIEVTTIKGHSPSLPNYVKVTYSDGSTNKLKTIWPVEIDQSKYSTAGTFTVEGSIVGESTKISAAVTVVDEEEAAKYAVSESFDLSDISLDKIGENGSILTQNRDRDLAYLKLLDNKRMLYNFYKTFGETEAIKDVVPLGGWDEPSGLLRGHSTGHYMSALALAYASTGDAEIKAKLDEMVSELRKLQLKSKGNAADFKTAGVLVSGWSTDPSEWGEGFISAYSPDQFALLEQYTPYGSPDSGIWAPYYTLHKLLAGLLDAYTYTGNREALDTAKALGKWAYNRLSVLPQEQLTNMWDMYIAGEFGGMNESLAQLYIYAKADGDEDADLYLKGAKLFDNTIFFDNLAENVDDIKGRHANQHIPQIIGALKMYEATVESGSPDMYYYDIAKNFWQMTVSRYAYSIGGVGTGEKFTQPYQQANNIAGTTNCETCAAYNMMKMTKMLNNYDPDNAEYMDYYESTLYNQILASQNPNVTNYMHNGTTYMLPIGPGSTRDFGDDYNAFTCCHGTGMENHVKYQEAAYSKTDDTLYVGLYLPSTVTWEEKGVKVVQETSFPSENTKLTVSAADASVASNDNGAAAPSAFNMKLRVPYWATNGFTVKVNGEEKIKDPEISTYVELKDVKVGDVIEINAPWTLHLDKTPDKLGSSDVASVMYGPFVMAAQIDSTSWKTLVLSENLSDSIKVSTSEETGFPTLTANGYDFAPMFSPEYAEKAYDAYFKVITAADDGKPWYEASITNSTPKYGTFTLSADLVKEGDDLVITAIPNDGYMVKKLLVNGEEVQVGEDNTYTVTGVDKEIVVEGSFRLINPPTPDPAHLEFSATASSDFTADWENVDGIMADWEPTASNGGIGYGWGNWPQDSGSEHYVQYEWDTPVTMNRFDIYWYDDTGDTRVPASMKIMYLADDGSWKEANMTTDFATAVEVDQYNTFKFDEITTTAVKLVLTIRDDAAATGIYRWKVSKEEEQQAPTEADKKALNDAITAAKALKEADYTADSWKKFSDALTAAQAAAAKADATQAEVDAAAKALTDAQAALVRQAQADVGVKVSSVKFTAKTYKVLAGKKLDLSKKVKVAPNNAANKALKWAVSNTKYATVSAKGVVSAKTAGAGKTVTVTAAAADGSKKIASAKVKITDAVKKITLKAAKSVKAGKSVKVKATVNTIKKKNAKVTLKWTVSSKKYATVSKKGVVKTKKAGAGKTVKVTAAATDGSGKKATLKIKIKK